MDGATPPNIGSDCTFNVTVTDTTAPEFNASVCTMGFATTADPSSGSASVTWDAFSTDNSGDDPTVVCLPEQGSFPIGKTVVTCTAMDGADPPNIAADCTFSVTVTDVTAPVFDNKICQTGITAAAESESSNANVTWNITATDNSGKDPTVTCSPAEGSFPIGKTGVTCIALDGATPPNNALDCTFNVTVADITPPVFTSTVCSSVIDTTAESESRYARVTWDVTATDNSGDDPIVVCSPGQGNFPIGETEVTCTAMDGAKPPNNAANCIFVVSVTDITPPVFQSTLCNSLINVAAGSDSRYANVTWNVTAIDNSGEDPITVCSHQQGSFPIGETMVTCTAVDGAMPPNNASDCSFNVTVTGPVSPTFESCPSDIVAYTYNSELSIPITWEVPTAFVGSSSNPATVACSMQPGNFLVGQQTVICTATDRANPTSTSSDCSFVVSVEVGKLIRFTFVFVADNGEPSVFTPSLMNSFSLEFIQLQSRLHSILQPLLSVLPELGYVHVVDFYSGSVGVNGISGFPINTSIQEEDVQNALRQSITSDNMLGTSGLTIMPSTVSTQELCKDGFCLNGGTCSVQATSFISVCSCNADYVGANCQTLRTVDSQSGGVIAAIVSASVLVTLVCIFAVLIICSYVTRLHRKGQMESMYPDWQHDELPPRLSLQAGKGDQSHRSSQRSQGSRRAGDGFILPYIVQNSQTLHGQDSRNDAYYY